MVFQIHQASVHTDRFFLPNLDNKQWDRMAFQLLQAHLWLGVTYTWLTLVSGSHMSSQNFLVTQHVISNTSCYHSHTNRLFNQLSTMRHSMANCLQFCETKFTFQLHLKFTPVSKRYTFANNCCCCLWHDLYAAHPPKESVKKESSNWNVRIFMILKWTFLISLVSFNTCFALCVLLVGFCGLCFINLLLF